MNYGEQHAPPQHRRKNMKTIQLTINYWSLSATNIRLTWKRLIHLIIHYTAVCQIPTVDDSNIDIIHEHTINVCWAKVYDLVDPPNKGPTASYLSKQVAVSNHFTFHPTVKSVSFRPQQSQTTCKLSEHSRMQWELALACKTEPQQSFFPCVQSRRTRSTVDSSSISYDVRTTEQSKLLAIRGRLNTTTTAANQQQQQAAQKKALLLSQTHEADFE